MKKRLIQRRLRAVFALNVEPEDVAVEKQRRRDRFSETGQFGRQEQTPRRRKAHQNDEEQRGQDTPDPAQVELAERDAAGLFLFAQQDQRDEVTRQDEEQVHPQEAAGDQRGAAQRYLEVIDHHRQNRDRAQPVDFGPILQ